MGFATRSAQERPLRRGDIVEVRSAAEILATLDRDGALDGLPFMPEMATHVGRRYTVSRRVDKICDTVSGTGSRRTHSIVYLEDLRCDGSGHDGCQAACKIYWKDAWLRRVDDGSERPDPGGGTAELGRLAGAATRTVRELDGERVEAWRCQATDALEFSEPLRTSNLAQYWRELRNGNFTPLRFIRVLARAVVIEVANRVGLLKPLPLHGREGGAQSAELGLRPGDLVQVRSPDEIEATLDEKGMDRGLSFDREMLPYCGRTVRVVDTVHRIIDDKTGRMLKIPKDSLILEGAVCSGERTPGCWFCPRQIYPFWREAWVRPVSTTDSPEPTDASLVSGQTSRR